MPFRLAFAALVATAVCAQMAAAQTPPAYYCDPLRVYYPAVPTCPVPWRPVQPAAEAYKPVQQPIPLASPQTRGGETDEYRQGVADWRDLQAWFGAQTGDRRAGADYWAANRSIAGHASCVAAAPAGNQDFVAACEEAKRRLGPIDERRHNDPQYQAGFKSASLLQPLAQSEPARTNAAPDVLLPPSATRQPSSSKDGSYWNCLIRGEYVDITNSAECKAQWQAHRQHEFEAWLRPFDGDNFAREIKRLYYQTTARFCGTHSPASCEMYKGAAWNNCLELTSGFPNAISSVRVIRRIIPACRRGK